MPGSKKLAAHYKSSYSFINMKLNKIHQTSSVSFNKIMAKYIFKKIISKKRELIFLIMDLESVI